MILVFILLKPESLAKVLQVYQKSLKSIKAGDISGLYACVNY